MLIQDYIKEKQNEIDQFLERHLPNGEKPSIIYEAMRYSLFAGGKRIRPIISLMINEMLGGEKVTGRHHPAEDRMSGSRKESVFFPACAIELIHTYSLIHDDLPALDNDDFRRGQPSNHKKYGEAIAILTGDAFLTLAFQWIARTKHRSELVVAILNQVSEAAGVAGMIGGQVADLQAEGQVSFRDKSYESGISENIEVNYENELEYIHLHKTAALIRAAVMVGALTAEVRETELAKCYKFGSLIGLAFQVTDDILDVEGEQKSLGKSVGKDAKSNKLTYPAVHGLEYSKKKAKEMIEQSQEILSYFKNSERVKQFANMIIHRKN